MPFSFTTTNLLDDIFLSADCRLVVRSQSRVERFKNLVKVVFKNKDKRIFGVKLSNGEVITVKCAENDTWDEEKALLACFAKWEAGNNGTFNKLFILLDNVVDTSKGQKKND